MKKSKHATIQQYAIIHSYYLQRNFQTCEQCPDYYPGEEPGSSTIGTITPTNQWNGLLQKIDEQSWEGGFCTGLAITNSSNRAATDFEVF